MCWSCLGMQPGVVCNNSIDDIDVLTREASGRQATKPSLVGIILSEDDATKQDGECSNDLHEYKTGRRFVIFAKIVD